MLDIYYLDGRIRQAKAADLTKLTGKPVWIDAVSITKAEAEILRQTYNLHPLTSEDMQNTRARIKVEQFNEYLFCVFYGMAKGKHIEPIEVDFVLMKDLIITNHKKPLASTKDLKADPERLKALFDKGVEFIFHKVLDDEVDNYFPVLESLDRELEKLEDEATKSPKPPVLNKIIRLKRQIVHLRRTAMSQREKISYLAKGDYPQLSKRVNPYIRDVYDHSIRVADTLDNYREAAGSAFDSYMSAVSNNMNEVMKVLSIIATIALPLTVVSGIYGTNFANLPGAGFHYGFWIMVGLMGAMCLAMLAFFRSRDWI